MCALVIPGVTCGQPCNQRRSILIILINICLYLFIGFYAEVAELRRRVADLNVRCANPAAVLVAKEEQLCEQQRWENAKFGCELVRHVACGTDES